MPKKAHIDPEEEEDDDPVLAEYDVYLTDSSIQRFLFQYPNRKREHPYNEAVEQKPQQLRLKPKTGLVEVDIPINTSEFYDDQKGSTYGNAMRKSRLVRSGGGYGMSGGLSEGPRSVFKTEDEAAALMGRRHSLANETDLEEPLAVQTLGGRIVPAGDGDPIYMLGAFRNNEIHLSKLDGAVQLRPELHHVDAVVDSNRRGLRGQRDVDDAVRQGEARAVEMKVKQKGIDGEDMNSKKYAEQLSEIQEERWQKYDFRDDEDFESTTMYHEYMFNKDTDNTPRLISAMTNGEYLDAISAPRRDPTRPERKKVLTKIRSRDSMTDPGETTEAADDSDVMEITQEKKVEPKAKAKRKPRAKKAPTVGLDGASGGGEGAAVQS